MSDISIQKLNEILKELSTITADDYTIFTRIAERAKAIVKNSSLSNSDHALKIQGIQNRIRQSVLGLHTKYIQELIGRVQIMIDELEINNHTIGIPSTTNSHQHITSSDKSKVFIVHGHDEEAKSKTARFIEKLGLEAIILHEQVSSSKTIIEKIEEHSNVGFGIVLYTPCDIGGKQVTNPILKSRARQNVVFEHGFLIGKINRSNVCALVKGDIETPNDVSGVVYTSMDEAGAWRYTIARELKNSGYHIDMNKI